MIDSAQAALNVLAVPEQDETVEKVGGNGWKFLGTDVAVGFLGSFCSLLWFSSFTDFLLSLMSSRAA
jgi:hypothetical protein